MTGPGSGILASIGRFVGPWGAPALVGALIGAGVLAVYLGDTPAAGNDLGNWGHAILGVVIAFGVALVGFVGFLLLIPERTHKAGFALLGVPAGALLAWLASEVL